MATRKLFYEDSHIKTFCATVTACRQCENGYRITLDATAFYPEGGGQGCDLGTLSGVKVLDVKECGQEVVHLCDGPLAVGETVEGTIDWQRRFDLMQQHTGEHILSGLLYQKFGCQNTGFHVGAEVMEVDFDCNPTWEELMEIEAQANAVIWENVPVRGWYPSEKELPDIAYRTKRALAYPVRLVQIPGVDSCACCGVHTAATGEVGVLKILSAVKFHQGIRLEMVCGNRAYRYFVALLAQAKWVSNAFSAKVLEIGRAADKVNDTLAGEKLRANILQTQIFHHIADRYENQETIVHFAPNLTSAQVRQLADILADKAQQFAAVFSEHDGSYQFCLASRAKDLRPLGKALTSACHGRGGGKAEFQQGSVTADQEKIEEFFGNHFLFC